MEGIEDENTENDLVSGMLKLWSLLTRSNLYANCLLSLMEENQKRQHQSTEKVNLETQVKSDGSISDQQTVALVLNDLLKSIAKLLENDLLGDYFAGKSKNLLLFIVPAVTGYVDDVLESNQCLKTFEKNLMLSSGDWKKYEKCTQDLNEKSLKSVNDLKLCHKPQKVPSEEEYLHGITRRGFCHYLENECEDKTNTNLEFQPDPTEQRFTENKCKGNLNNVNTFTIVKGNSQQHDLPRSQLNDPSMQNYQENSNAFKVSCPVCFVLVASKSINKHLDTCTTSSLKKKSLRSYDESLKSGEHNRKSIAFVPKSPKCNFEAFTKRLIKRKSYDMQLKKEKHEYHIPDNESIGKPASVEVDSHPILPTGLEDIKQTLQQSLVVKAVLNNKKKIQLNNFPRMLLFSKSESKPKTTTKRIALQGRNTSKELGNTDTSSSEEDMDFEIASLAMATRRSSRTRTNISYHETSDDCETEEESVNEVQNRNLITKKCDHINICNKRPMKSSYHIQSTKQFALETSNHVCEEEGELGMVDIDFGELLQKRFYHRDLKSYVTKIAMKNQTRYLFEEQIDSFQPILFTGGVLHEYQVTGYQWLKVIYEFGENALLADEMGLGKTVQCIALICELVKANVSGPYLVCAPTTTITNWFNEFKKFAPGMSLLLYYGSTFERWHLVNLLHNEIKHQTQLIIITSYDVLLRDLAMFKGYNWAILILDEGHRVKNYNSKTIKQLKKISARSKVMLTGTPLQNDLTELWSLLNFLFPDIFDDVKSFQSWCDFELLKKDQKILSILHQVLVPFLLRRVKSDVGMEIPPKREILIMAPLAQLQEKLYRSIVDKCIMQLVRNKKFYNKTSDITVCAPCCRRQVRSNSVNNKAKERDNDYLDNITTNNMMMQLRKCCNHPYLIKHPIIDGTTVFKVDDNIVKTCGKMILLDRMLHPLKEKGHKVLIFSQMTLMLDILEDYCEMRGYKTVRFDGSTKCQDRAIYIDLFNNDPSVFIFLLSTRAGGLGINLTSADTVIIYDSDWNPQNDIQAQDRCHRIGQERPVVVYRLVTASTIDQEIVERALRKRSLEKMIIHDKKFKGELQTELKNCKTIGANDLLDLLESNNINRNLSKEKSNDCMINDYELHLLLDRTHMWSQGRKDLPLTLRPDSNWKFHDGSSGSFTLSDCRFRVLE